MDVVSYLLGLGSALLVGFSKTGLPGVSIPGILLMTEAFPDDAKLSLGAILPVLLAGDVFAVCWYRHHAQWRRLLGLFPYVLAGMVPGVFVLLWVQGNELRPLLGWLILGLLAIEVGRRWRDRRAVPVPVLDTAVDRSRNRAGSFRQPPCPMGPTCTCGECGVVPAGQISVAAVPGSEPLDLSAATAVALLRQPTVPLSCPTCCLPLPTVNLERPQSEAPVTSPAVLSASWWFMASMGLLAGLSTMIANAAMPVMTIYLISRRLRKEQFMGTAAWFFFLINLSKLPVCYWLLDVITPRTMQFGLIVAPMTVAGALMGVYVLRIIPQRFFDALALSLAGVAAVRLIVV